MTPEERRKGAFAEFGELLSEGLAVEAAISTAAKHNDLMPENFRVIAEKELGDLETYRQRITHRTDYDRFLALASAEVGKCKNREGHYRSLGFTGWEQAIFESVEAALCRPLRKHETWLIEEMLDPVVFRAKQQVGRFDGNDEE